MSTFDKRSLFKCKYVYFVRVAGTPIVKIGMAISPEERIKGIQWGCPCKVELAGWIRCNDAYTLEQFLHKKFAAKRISGEWFLLDRPEIDVLMTEIKKRKRAYFNDAEWEHFAEKNPQLFSGTPNEITRAFFMNIILWPEHLVVDETKTIEETA